MKVQKTMMEFDKQNQQMEMMGEMSMRPRLLCAHHVRVHFPCQPTSRAVGRFALWVSYE